MIMPATALLFSFGVAGLLPSSPPARSVGIELVRSLPIATINTQSLKENASSSALRFIVDTGAGMTVLDDSLIETLGLKVVGEMEAIGTGGSVTTKRIESVTFDLLREKISVPAIGTPIGGIGKLMATRIDGILGYDYFVDRIVRIDYKTKELGHLPLNWEPNLSKYARLPIDIRGRRPYVRATIILDSGGEVEHSMLLDTGANEPMSLPESLAQEKEMPMEDSGWVGGVGGMRKGKKSKIKGVKFDTETIALNSVGIDPTTRAPRGGRHEPGNIGSGLFEGREVIVDYSHRAVYVSRKDR